MTLLEFLYRSTHRNFLKRGGKIPYYWKYSLITVMNKPIRKFFSAVIIPIIPFCNLRILLYKMCGYKIGKNVFIGMRCYLDDMCYDKIIIGDNVIISYGVYFACHGRKQSHNVIEICNGAYIGMKASIVARQDIRIGENAIIGACSLVNKSIPNDVTAVGIPIHVIDSKIDIPSSKISLAIKKDTKPHKKGGVIGYISIIYAA